MVIYGEILFLENAVAGALILWLTTYLCKSKLSWKRMILGSVLCGLYSFTIIQTHMLWVWSLLEKLLFSMILIRICFDSHRYWLKLTVFYGISFLMGGVTMGLLGFCSVPALSANGSFYIERMSFLHLIFGVSLTVVIIHLLFVMIKEYRYDLHTKREVIISHRGKEISVQGFLDTGNRLMDPETGLPVCLVSQGLWNTLVGDDVPLRWISYRGATGFEGLLAVMEPERFRILHRKGEVICKAVLGTGLDLEGSIRWEGCPVLLNGYISEECMGLEVN